MKAWKLEIDFVLGSPFKMTQCCCLETSGSFFLRDVDVGGSLLVKNLQLDLRQMLESCGEIPNLHLKKIHQNLTLAPDMFMISFLTTSEAI